MAKGKTSSGEPESALVYVRVSTARQAESGAGLEAQEAACCAEAARLGLPVVALYRDEGVSGREGPENRPGLAALLAHANRDPGAVVLVYSVSRLARRQRLLWELLDERKGQGLRIRSATEPFETATPMGRALLGMLAVWSQLEADLASERTRDALAAVAARGVRLGAPSMIETRGPDGARTLDPFKVDTVRKVAALHASGAYSLRQLAAHLEATDTPTVTGEGRWWPRTIRRALELAAELPQDPASPPPASSRDTVSRQSPTTPPAASSRRPPRQPRRTAP